MKTRSKQVIFNGRLERKAPTEHSGPHQQTNMSGPIYYLHTGSQEKKNVGNHVYQRTELLLRRRYMRLLAARRPCPGAEERMYDSHTHKQASSPYVP